MSEVSKEPSEVRAGMDLIRYDNGRFHRGRSWWIEALWLLVQGLFIRSWLPGAAHRRWLLRLFGAQIGSKVDIKPGVRVKFPWKLKIGDHSWIGEDAWIDNLAEVQIGANCCVSQGAYLCTGNHDWRKPAFDLVVKPIHIEDGAWVAARAVVAPGITIGEGAVLALGSVATRDLLPGTVYRGCPAIAVHSRKSRKTP